MNERIKELAKQANAIPIHGKPKDRALVGYDNIEKFAKLIVHECNMALNPMLRDMISRGQACRLINEHFGFE